MIKTFWEVLTTIFTGSYGASNYNLSLPRILHHSPNILITSQLNAGLRLAEAAARDSVRFLIGPLGR